MTTIRLDRDPRGVATVTLARPEKRNAMDAAMIGELTDAAEALAGDDGVRVVVLAAEGAVFCAGGDLGWMRDQAGKDRDGQMQQSGALARMLGAWNALPKPVIGRVQGAAYGGGLGLVCACDTVIVEDAARFALTETRLGLIPATIGPFVVARLGAGFARQVFLNARPFDAGFLLRAGAAARSVPGDGLDAAVEEEITALLDCAPGAVAAAKALLQSLSGPDPAEFADMTAGALADRWASAEAQEGIAAFFAKRRPGWQRPS